MASFKLVSVCILVLIMVGGLPTADAGLFSYGICQTGCNAVAVACYAAAGFTFGTVTAGVAVPPAIIACNSALGVCMAACAGIALTPTP